MLCRAFVHILGSRTSPVPGLAGCGLRRLRLAGPSNQVLKFRIVVLHGSMRVMIAALGHLWEVLNPEP